MGKEQPHTLDELSVEAANLDKMSLLVDAETRTLIELAADLSGQSSTEFALVAVRSRAMAVLSDEHRFVLSPEQHDVFLQMLDNPPPPGEKLLALAKRTPPWA